MDQDAMKESASPIESRRAENGPRLHAPRVSIIITNFNYRDYVGEAIRSAFAQTYPNIEVVVVDDVSTDDSIDVITEHLRGRDNAYLYRRVLNGGQGAAFLDGLRNSSGEFVCFLDADDVLMPEFCAAHVYLHLAIPQQIAFTSTDLAHITNTGAVSAGSSGNIRHAFTQAEPADFVTLPKVQISKEVDELLERHRPSGRLVYLPPSKVGYHWASCSGLMFKRAALELIAFEDGLAPTRLSADFYVTLTHLISGSAVLDTKLGGYRIHGKNGYSTETHLDGIDTSRRTPSAFYQDILQRFVRLMVTTEFEHFWGVLGKGWRYHEVLGALHTYIHQFDRDRLYPKIIESEILDGWDVFAARVGYDHARWILNGILGVPDSELRGRGID